MKLIERINHIKKVKVSFDVKSIYDGHQKISYRGIKAIKCPFDYVLYQMIVFDLKPDLIIEIGTCMGGCALYLADLLNILGHGVVHTIDIEPQSSPVLASHPRIELFTNGWENYDPNLTHDFKTILVIDDASHVYEDTLGAMLKFAPVVTKNSYLIVEDGIINELGRNREFKGGPLRAIREFLSKRDDFVIARRWCDFFGTNATFNVNGYLEKVI